MAADETTKLAKQLVDKFPNHPSRSLARMLVEKTNNHITMENARSRIRWQLGIKANGRKKAKLAKRKKRQPGDRVPAMPRSEAEHWGPVTLDVQGLLGIISDTHIPYHCETAVQTAVKFLKKKKLDCLLINGDFCDFYTISRWVKNPSKRDFGSELKACREALKWIRHQFPNIPIVFKAGNHEERWDAWLWQHAPEISMEEEMTLARWLKLDDLEIEWVSDQKPILAGDLAICHGHELPKGIAAPVNVARGAFMRTLSSVLVGHSHRTSGHAETDMWHKETFCWSVGCLCDMNPEYARINKWNHGFACVDIDKSGSFDVENYRISKNGEVRSS
tara:strand:- start:1525 stop:2523 length:999 start_codon:yes stop_codon:yes gene_type:complete